MPTFKERLTDFLLGDEKRRMQESYAQSLNIALKAYQEGPWQLPPEELARQLKEVDPGLLDYLMSQVGWTVLGGLGYTGDTDAERERAVQESLRLWKYSPLAQWTVWLWSAWGLGEGVTITPNDKTAAEIWKEFWEADRNACLFAADRIQRLSHWLLLTGNRFFSFYASDQDAETTARLIQPAEITAIVTNPEDSAESWFYKREWTPTGKNQQTMFYPDWETFFSEELEERWEKVIKAYPDIRDDSKRADLANGNQQQLGGEALPSTGVCILHVAHNLKDEASLWGWPILTTAQPYIAAHKKFSEDRLSVASAVAMYVRRYQHGGGSRAQRDIISTIASNLSQSQYADTNPPAAAGSSEILNKALDVTDLPLRTGASDAKSDNEMFLHQAGLGGGLFPVSYGLDTARYATALEMDKAQSMLFTNYQSFWAAQWRKMVKIVLSFQEKYNRGSFKDKGAEVSTDTLSLADFPAVAKTVGGLVKDAIAPMVTDGTIPEKAGRKIMAVLTQINLQALGVDKAQDLADAEEWQKEVDKEEEERPEPQPPPAGFQFQPGQTPPQPQGEQPQPEVVERIAEMILQNAREGIVDWEAVAEWALAEKMEGEHGRMDQC